MDERKKYIDLRTGETKIRHTDYGAEPFAANNRLRNVGNSQSQLEDALKAVQKNGGGTIQLIDDLIVDKDINFVDNLRLTGGSITAADSYKGGQILNVQGARNWRIDDVTVDGNGRYVLGTSIRDSDNGFITNSEFLRCRTGIYIEKGSSNITIEGGSSHDHHQHHGIAIDDKRCESIAVLSMELYNNPYFGLDSHGTGGEAAGCLIYDNGSGSGGSCVKFPEAVDWRLHDCELRATRGKYGLVWTYEIERRPSGVLVYRCTGGGPTLYVCGKGGTITYYDNDFDVDDDTVIKAGPGILTEDVDLGSLPDIDWVDPEDPEEPEEPKSYITQEQAIALYYELFSQTGAVTRPDVQAMIDEAVEKLDIVSHA